MTDSRKKIHIFNDKHLLAKYAVKVWTDISKRAIGGKGYFSVALSGGKTPEEFYQRLAEQKDNLPWDLTHIFLADERFVAADSVESNLSLIKKNLIDPLQLNSENIHYAPFDTESPEAAAEKYEDDIRKFFQLRDGAFPVFDIVALGIGQDGHTASLFPNDKSLKEMNKIAVAVSAKGEPKCERVTLTLPVINNARNIMFLVTGENKADIARKVVYEQNKDYPASLTAPKNGELIFLLDKDANKSKWRL